MKQSSPIKKLLEALVLVMEMCTGFISNMSWMKTTKVCSFTSKPSQGTSLYVSSFKDSSVLLNMKEDPNKSEILLVTSTLLEVKAENIYQNATKMHQKMEAELSN